MAITLYRSKYLSISLMALFTLLTLFSFHFRLSLKGQIECSVVMGLMASPSRFLPFFTLPHLFTSSILILYLALSNSHSLTSLIGILVHSSTILKPILQIQKLCQKFRPNLKPRYDKLTTPT